MSLPEVLPLRRASETVVRELGFLESHWHALMAIEAGVQSQANLAAKLRLDKSTTSRIVERLRTQGLVRVGKGTSDARSRRLSLTKSGAKKVQETHAIASVPVQRALEILSAEERAMVARGVDLYAKALERSRLRQGFTVRALRKADNRAVAHIIRTVMPEFGADGAGFAIHDPEVLNMHGAYSAERSAYFVLVDPAGAVVGGAGVAPLAGGDGGTCELRKMYFLAPARGLGFGQTLLERCLSAARALGYRRCYLETLTRMHQARSMYQKNGFLPLAKPEGATGHFGCDAWYARSLW